MKTVGMKIDVQDPKRVDATTGADIAKHEAG